MGYWIGQAERFSRFSRCVTPDLTPVVALKLGAELSQINGKTNVYCFFVGVAEPCAERSHDGVNTTGGHTEKMGIGEWMMGR